MKTYSLSRNVETTEDTGYKYIHYGDIHTKVADKIDDFNNLPNIEIGNYDLLKKGDVILADASEDYQGIATPAIVMKEPTCKLVSGLHTIALRPRFVEPLFLYYLIHSQSFRKYGYKTGTGMKVFGISVKNVLKFKGKYPLKKEQIKISSFFKQLEDTIALHQDKLSKLEQLKQGYMQKIFPQNGESVPKIRFANINDEWEQRKLKDVLTVNSGRDYKHLGPGDIPVYGTGGYMLSVNDKLSISDAIGIGRKGTIDKPQLLKAPFWTVDTLYYMTPNNKADLLFYYNLVNNIRWKKYDESTGVPSLSKSTIENIILREPKFEEQLKIGAFFNQLDNIFAHQSKKIDNLQKLKKAYLQKMFI